MALFVYHPLSVFHWTNGAVLHILELDIEFFIIFIFMVGKQFIDIGSDLLKLSWLQTTYLFLFWLIGT